MKLPIDKSWSLLVNSDAPTGCQIIREDGRFFKVVFNNSMGYIQPVIEENTNADGVCGSVIPIVKRAGDQLMVAVADNKRPGTISPLYLTEATRFSVDNSANAVQSDLNVCELGTGYSNSARILGQIKCGVLVVDDSFALPQNSRWISLKEFADTTDMMGQAALFRYLVSE